MLGEPASGTVRLRGVASAFPPVVDQKALLEGYFLPRASGSAARARLVRAAFSVAGVRRRHTAVDPRREDVASWSTGERMARFIETALPLATGAVAAALERAEVRAERIGLLVVASCTGYATPGIDALVARALGCGPGTRRLLIGHAGCHAALVGLGAASDAVRARGEPAVVCCVELSSLHVQPDAIETSQLAVHALFGDAAAAAVLSPGGATEAGLELVASATDSLLANADLLTWAVTDRGFRMGLSPRLPEAVGKAVRPLTERLLATAGLQLGDVARWVVHPGGPRVLDAVEAGLGLGPEALAHSRAVLAERGNCSSATVLVVLEALLGTEPPVPGDHVVLLAFGPGLTLEAALLRAR